MPATPFKLPKKLIEVALPLDAINVASAREKSIRYGHPSTLHLWWARRPLAAARAVIFAQLVNDPGFQQGQGFRYGKNKKDAEIERKRLFTIIECLVKWENTSNEEVLEVARAEIRRSWQEVCDLNKDHPQAAELFNPDKMPGLHDPFAGGGAIPLEAQRLGLAAYASDLNPVAVMINKAMIEIPPKFAGWAPVAPLPFGEQVAVEDWRGATGLAEDVRRYGAWMRKEAEKRIGHLYPKIKVTPEMVRARPDLNELAGQELTVIAWLWARTVRSPNPAFSRIDVPLASTFVLSTKEMKDAYVEPVVKGSGYHFTVKVGKPPKEAAAGTKAPGRGADFRCLLSDVAISGAYIKGEAQAGRMGARLMAVVAEGQRGRVYLPPTDEMERVARSAQPTWKPELEFAHNSRHLTPWAYGLSSFGSLFTPRQLVALTTLCDLVAETRARVSQDAIASGMTDNGTGLEGGGNGATAYADSVATYLALSVDKVADYNSSLVAWSPTRDQAKTTFSRQALSMVWDFAEVNPFAGAAGDFFISLEGIVRSIRFSTGQRSGVATQDDAQRQSVSAGKFVSTDPPYYDNVPYADLADFFYVWLRRSTRDAFPSLFSTIAVPKAEELVADPFRHQSREAADRFFLVGMTLAMQRICEQTHPAAPITIYYAFKQSESDGQGGTSSSGWEIFLDAVIRAGLVICGTWPMRTERESRSRGLDSNALASSIVLVCRQRPADATTISRREFLRELNLVLPEALDEMTKGSGDDRSPVAPVDLSQAIIGPGMAVFSKYAAVLEANGEPMTVRTALQLINRFLAEDDFDHDTQFCLHWFEQHGWREGVYGEADVLARAKGTSVSGLVDAGVIESGGGKVRILRYEQYPPDWDPRSDKRLPMWEALHHLIRLLRHGGESEAGRVLAVVRDRAEPIRQLAYRLYTLCERAGAAEDARAYNELVGSWSAIETAAGTIPPPPAGQMDLFGGGGKP
jgi:putative DNA methylase